MQGAERDERDGIIWHNARLRQERSLPDWRIRCEELKIKARDIYWCHDRMVYGVAVQFHNDLAISIPYVKDHNQ
jgi:hypothetical protein